MSDWSTVFLGVIAASSLTVALIQVGLLIAAARAARAAAGVFDRFEARLDPLMKRADALGDEAGRVLARVGSGVERTERMLESVEARLDRASDAVEAGMRVPVREASAVMAGVQAVASTFRRRMRSDRPPGPYPNGSRFDDGNDASTTGPDDGVLGG
jgi:hypothetical protein